MGRVWRSTTLADKGLYRCILTGWGSRRANKVGKVAHRLCVDSSFAGHGLRYHCPAGRLFVLCDGRARSPTFGKRSFGR